MSLVTRCPHCNTLFRVQPQQLQAKGGQVRCGRCMQVFDGFGSLGGGSGPGSGDAPTLAHAKKPISKTEAAQKAPVAAEPVFERRPPRRGAMMAACVLLVVLFLGQLTYVLRGELAARYPAMKAALTSACGTLGCVVSLPQRPDLVKIEASDVNMLEEGRPALIQLTATLRSYADHDVAYPALDLVLTNATEHALARRIFLPEEYLAGTRDPQAGMPARAEITVALDLDTDELNAAGFRVDLLAAH